MRLENIFIKKPIKKISSTNEVDREYLTNKNEFINTFKCYSQLDNMINNNILGLDVSVKKIDIKTFEPINFNF